MTQLEALAILKTGRNVFLTGEPGSGKTYTINSYVSYLKSHGVEPAITASTGIAATHIGGMTIHSWSGIGINKTLSRDDLKSIANHDRLFDRIIGCSVLIIDEISMLDGQTLGLVDAVCKTIRKSDVAFGGIQVVLVGDFFQLPPVARFGEREPQFAFNSNAWLTADPTVCYLSEHHRHDDAVFLQVLKAVRSGFIDETDRAHLLSRQAVSTEEDIPKLYPHNNNVDTVNDIALKKLPGPTAIFAMTHHGARNLVEQLKRGCLSPEQLVLKIGARVMFTKNSFNGTYVNGTVGVVVSFSSETGYPIVRKRSGKTLEVDPVQWSIKVDGRPLASISQLPLRLAWAMTVHKSQGMSLDAAYVDLSQAFAFGQGYVALSRVRSLEGLFLGGLNDRALEVNPEILEVDARFHAQSDAAETELASCSNEMLTEKHQAFLLASGGSIAETKKSLTPVKEKKTKKEPTILTTVALIKKGMTIEAAAKERDLTPGTILKHLEELQMSGKLPKDDIRHLHADAKESIELIHSTFRVLNHQQLKPTFARLNGAFSYETIRLARLLYGIDSSR